MTSKSYIEFEIKNEFKKLYFTMLPSRKYLKTKGIRHAWLSSFCYDDDC